MLQQYSNVLPPQQILQANGKASIDALRMSPNSSVLIADNTAPIVWKCVSDGLGNVSAEPFDITPHKTQEQIEKDNLIALIQSIDKRLQAIEVRYDESIIKQPAEPDDSEFITSKKTATGRKRPTSTNESDDAGESKL